MSTTRTTLPDGSELIVSTFYDGSRYEDRWKDGKRNDGPNGEPATVETRPDGYRREERWKNGKLISTTITEATR